jgi:hypothetical protein
MVATAGCCHRWQCVSRGGGRGNKLFHLVFVVNMIIFTGAPVMTMRSRRPTGESGVVATADTPDGASAPGNTGEARDNARIAENDTSNLSGNISCGACLPFWRITCMLISAVVVCCIDG